MNPQEVMKFLRAARECSAFIALTDSGLISLSPPLSYC